MGAHPLSLHMDSRQAQLCLRSAESGIDRAIWEGILKVRQSLSCNRAGSRRPRTSRNWQTSSNSHPPVPPAPDPALLTASQLSWAQQSVPQDDPRHPASISTRANCKSTPFGCSSGSPQPKAPPTPIRLRPPRGPMS
jgi:hypothetical protein